MFSSLCSHSLIDGRSIGCLLIASFTLDLTALDLSVYFFDERVVFSVSTCLKEVLPLFHQPIPLTSSSSSCWPAHCKGICL